MERKCDRFWVHEYVNPKYRESETWNQETVHRNNGVAFRGKVWVPLPIRKRSGSKGPLNMSILHNSDEA